MSNLKIDSIHVLYRRPDSLCLYGIPYAMRPGQSPRDLIRAEWPAKSHERYMPPLKRSGELPSDWIYLGTNTHAHKGEILIPWWSGDTSTSDPRPDIKAFLTAHADSIPDGPGEWCSLEAP